LGLDAMFVGEFDVGDDFIQRRLDPPTHQLSTPVVDRERLKVPEKECIPRIA
jgi:hypothetical protein